MKEKASSGGRPREREKERELFPSQEEQTKQPRPVRWEGPLLSKHCKVYTQRAGDRKASYVGGVFASKQDQVGKISIFLCSELWKGSRLNTYRTGQMK